MFRSILAAIIALTIVAVGGYTIGNQRVQSRKAICEQIELLKEPIRQSMIEGIKTIPTLEYYKTHPVERDKQLVAAQITLSKFAPRKC